jgi:hypothetical protein
MKIIKMLLLMLFVLPCYSKNIQSPETITDFKKLGYGDLYYNKNMIIKNITIREIKDISIVYEKNGSLHDMLIENINSINYPKLNLKIAFVDQKPFIFRYIEYDIKQSNEE